MKKIVSMGDGVKKYMNGDIWIVFNQKGKDSTVVLRSDDNKKSEGVEKAKKLPEVKSPLESKAKSKGFYVKDALYLRLKASGKSPDSDKKLTEKLINKIKSYVPKTELW